MSVKGILVARVCPAQIAVSGELFRDRQFVMDRVRALNRPRDPERLVDLSPAFYNAGQSDVDAGNVERFGRGFSDASRCFG